MLGLFFIFIGGGIGASLRSVFTHVINKHLNASSFFPYGVLLANVIGSFLIGIVAACLIRYASHASINTNYYELFIITGVLGGFTTFSSFSYDTVKLIINGHIIQAISYVLISVITSILLTLAGFIIINFALKP